MVVENKSRLQVGSSAAKKNIYKAKKENKPKPSSFNQATGKKKVVEIFSLFFTLGVGLIVFVVIGISLLFLYRFVTTSTYFAIKDIDISGNSQLTYNEVLADTGINLGINSLAIKIDDIERSLKKNRWIKDVSVKRTLPDKVKIVINEHVPFFWILQNNEMYYVNAYGQLIAPVGSSKFISLPVLEINTEEIDISKELPKIVQVLEEASIAIPIKSASWIKVSFGVGLEIFLEQSDLRLVLGIDDLSLNLEYLGLVLNDLRKRNELKKVRELRAYNKSVWVITDIGHSENENVSP